MWGVIKFLTEDFTAIINNWLLACLMLPNVTWSPTWAS